MLEPNRLIPEDDDLPALLGDTDGGLDEELNDGREEPKLDFDEPNEDVLRDEGPAKAKCEAVANKSAATKYRERDMAKYKKVVKHL